MLIVSSTNVNAQNSINTTGPQIYSLAFDATSATPNDYISLSIDASEHKYLHIEISVYIPTESLSYGITSLDLGNESTGTFQINPYWRSGIYYVNSMFIEDYSANFVSLKNGTDYTSPQLSVTGTTPDTNEPALYGVSVNMNAATGNDVVQFFFNATDDISGIAHIQANIYSLADQFVTQINIDNNIYYNWSISPFMNPADVYVFDVKINDYAGNIVTYYNGSSFKSPVITIYGTTPDTTPPTIVSAGFVENTGSTIENVTVYVKINDDLSGAGSGTVQVSLLDDSYSVYVDVFPVNFTTLIGYALLPQAGSFYVNYVSFSDKEWNYNYAYNDIDFNSNIIYIEEKLFFDTYTVTFSPSTIFVNETTMLTINFSSVFTVNYFQLYYSVYVQTTKLLISSYLILDNASFNLSPNNLGIPSESIFVVDNITAYDDGNSSYYDDIFDGETLYINQISAENGEINIDLQSTNNFSAPVSTPVRFNIHVESTFNHNMYNITWGFEIYTNGLLSKNATGYFNLSAHSIYEISVDVAFNQTGNYEAIAYIIDDIGTRWENQLQFGVTTTDSSTTTDTPTTTDSSITTDTNSSIPALENPMPGFEFTAIVPFFAFIGIICRKRKS